MPKRATKTTKTRHYRITKKHPKRPKAVMIMDLGKVEQQIALTFPENSQYLNVEIPKTRNPDLFKIYFGNIKICWYFDEKKGFVFDENGLWLGSYDKQDLKKLFFKIGRLLRLEKSRKA
jgi:hypothetical protein